MVKAQRCQEPHSFAGSSMTPLQRVGLLPCLPGAIPAAVQSLLA
ncbi:hypothetical protein Pla123a_40110 [Posidoniimonas polymericola]|uniref:Uncharacterized protein n=1 Tax=Posidoniimonas polymericola TaxID=2528002 RepID=A0A5C5YHC7_9BACT|nr:hypothetical protein Pla123a_40110 [Posidoniimonas polymericola]